MNRFVPFDTVHHRSRVFQCEEGQHVNTRQGRDGTSHLLFTHMSIESISTISNEIPKYIIDRDTKRHDRSRYKNR